jgi:hypothetical protein
VKSKTLQKFVQSDLLAIGFVVRRSGKGSVKSELNSREIFKLDQASDP